MERAKISIIGAGNVGGSIAHHCAEAQLGDVVLLDLPQTETMPQGKALDLLQTGPIMRFDARIIGTNDYADTADSDVVVIAAGMPRKPGMSRDDLLATNARIVTDVARQVKATSPDAVLIVVTNPLDAMVHRAWQVTGFPPQRVMGQAGVVDTARFCCFIAAELGISVEDVSATIVGAHGDTMVPLAGYASVCGIPVTQLIPPAAAGRADRADPPRRGGDRLAVADRQRLPRPRRRHRRDGRGDRPRQETAVLLLGLLRQGVRRGRLLHRRAGGARRRRRRADHRGRAFARPSGAAFQQSVDSVKGLIDSMSRLAA